MRKLLLALLLAGVCSAQTYQGLTIPVARPRLIFSDATKLNAARAWWNAGNSFVPNNNYPADLAFAYLMGGNASYCTTAINYVMALEWADVLQGAAPKDNMRWHGFNIPATYDWCYDVMTPEQRSTLVSRWNTYLDTWRANPAVSGGGLDKVSYNYYYGYLRMETLWGIVTYHESTSAAQTHLDYALGTRWNTNAAPYNVRYYFANLGRGGMAHEGWQYGANVHEYLTTVILAAAPLGRNLTSETDWFNWNLFSHIYNNTTAPVRFKGAGTAYYEQIPHGDSHAWADLQSSASGVAGIGSALYGYIASFLGTNYARYSQQFINDVAPSMIGSHWMRCVAAIAGTAPTPLAYTGLALDFYSSGNGWLTSRKSWDSGATLFSVQGGQHRMGVSHYHADGGNFTIQRGNAWLTRESAAYGQSFPDYNNGTAAVASGAHAHNTIFMDGKGPTIYVTNSEPYVSRLEVGTHHSFLTSVLTPAYRTNISYPSRPERDNPAAVNVVRDFLFIRPLETVVIFDRLEAQNGSQMKTFMLHFENSPTLTDAQTIHYTSGSHTLHVKTVLPSSPTRRVIDETTTGGTRGQQRLELESNGTAQQYFMHVLQARDSSGSDLTINYSKPSTTHILELTHATLGYARVEFADGMTSTGGGFAYSADSMPGSVTAFRSGVQTLTITADGPQWAVSGGTDRRRAAGKAVIRGGRFR